MSLLGKGAKPHVWHAQWMHIVKKKPETTKIHVSVCVCKNKLSLYINIKTQYNIKSNCVVYVVTTQVYVCM